MANLIFLSSVTEAYLGPCKTSMMGFPFQKYLTIKRKFVKELQNRYLAETFSVSEDLTIS